MRIRTSVTDPIQVAWIELNSGSVGITFCPGKKDYSSIRNWYWDRDLDADISILKDSGCNHLVTLVEGFELDLMRVQDLGEKVIAAGINWIHYPIVDGSVPESRFDELRRELSSYLENGEKVIVHCRGGLGRAGTLATTLLVDSGEYSPEEALLKVRSVRRGAVETLEQELFIERLVQVERRKERRMS